MEIKRHKTTSKENKNDERNTIQNRTLIVVTSSISKSPIEKKASVVPRSTIKQSQADPDLEQIRHLITKKKQTMTTFKS